MEGIRACRKVTTDRSRIYFGVPHKGHGCTNAHPEQRKTGVDKAIVDIQRNIWLTQHMHSIVDAQTNVRSPWVRHDTFAWDRTFV